MNAPVGLKFCLMVMCAALLCTACRRGTSVSITSPCAQAQFAGSACHIDFFGTRPAAEELRLVGVLNRYGYKSLDYHARAVRSAY